MASPRQQMKNYSYSSRLQKDHTASIIIHYFNVPHDSTRIHLTKSRYDFGPGDVSVDEFLDVAFFMVAEKCYSGCAEVFQEGLRTEMKEAVNEVLVKHLIKAVKENDGITI